MSAHRLDGVFGWLFQQLEQFDLPYNQAPSLHIILLWLLWLRFYAHTPPRWHWLLHSWFTLIGVSVLTTWQHHFIDIVTGLAAGIVISYLLPINWRWQHSLDPRALILTKRYFIGAVLCSFAAVLIGGLFWLLLWPAMCLLMIGLGYCGLGVTVFQKNRQGNMSPSARVLLAPYQQGSWLSSLYFRRKTPLMNEIVPHIYLGSFPSYPLKVNAVLDMTCDWPRNRFSKDCSYIACPRLDLVAPSIAELEEAVIALDGLRTKGSILIHCALGRSRSAIVVVAWLFKQKYADTLDDVVKLFQPAMKYI